MLTLSSCCIHRCKRSIIINCPTAAQAEVYSIDYQQPTQQVHVPEGHLPPPGECRIWFPDRPAGHQPPPGPCHVLQYEVPPGAHLIRG
jgi:hypothetical protein